MRNKCESATIDCLYTYSPYDNINSITTKRCRRKDMSYGCEFRNNEYDTDRIYVVLRSRSRYRYGILGDRCDPYYGP